ncbi:MAG TPA: right-handed parallel beta-helix repeat-containing protein [Candidatus Baltobacteraceae bacterium]|nr:right-handed parallel beta-helix repeat-containing protein [Candidatus Baltobacteraceae bacterium]
MDDNSGGSVQDATQAAGQQAPTPDQPMDVPEYGTIGPQRRARVPPLFKILPILIGVIVLVIAVVAQVFFTGSHSVISSSTTSVLTSGAQGGIIYGCATLSKPGRYVLAQDTKTSATTGACINVTSDNVGVYCSNNRITGSGPFVNYSPFSYGVLINGRSNVSLVGCTIRNFSYGVYVSSSKGISVLNNNITQNYISELVMAGTMNSSVANNFMSRASSGNGALLITNGSTGNKVANNTIEYNQFYGINVNSTGNSYFSNLVNGTPISLFCSTQSSFPGTSTASGNICVNNTGCGFLMCKGVNIPANLSKLNLGNPISSCGSINQPGTYYMSGNIDMGSYINVSNPAAVYDNIRCINVAASGVTLDCMGHTISHGSYAIYSYGVSNLTLENCKISDFNTGIQLVNATRSRISNVSIVNASQFAISLTNTLSVSVQNSSATSSNFGLYLSNAASDVIGNPTMLMNQYGIYLTDSIGNIFQGGTALNSTTYDVYATADSVNASYNIMQGMSCGLTNAQWAGCTIKRGTLLPYYPISSCGAISHPGNYSLTSNIVNAQSNCITISSDNVQLGCAGRIINGLGSTPGSIIRMSGRNNVTVTDCGFYGLYDSVNITNSTSVFMSGIKSSSRLYGFYISGLSGGSLVFSTATGANNATVYMNNVTYFTLSGMNLTYAGDKGVGIQMINSDNDIVTNNYGLSNYVGIELSGVSKGNRIANNTMTLNNGYDYVCNGNSGVNDELGGINYGTTKSGCKWLAAVPLPITPLGCALVSSPDTITLTSDAVYGFGSTCMSVLANSTTVNCEGHTVIASNGGTFTYFQNVRNDKMVNCVLKDFSNPIFVTNSTQVTLQNNTISILNQTSGLAAITMLNTQSSQARGNNITAPYQGINFVGGGSGSVLNNIVSGAEFAYQINNATSVTVTNNTAIDSFTGISLVNANQNSFGANNASLGVTSGIACSSSSQSNVDAGGNICSVQSGCSWITSSSSTCHS